LALRRPIFTSCFSKNADHLASAFSSLEAAIVPCLPPSRRHRRCTSRWKIAAFPRPAPPSLPSSLPCSQLGAPPWLLVLTRLDRSRLPWPWREPPKSRSTCHMSQSF
jgi:hypothetical protein